MTAIDILKDSTNNLDAAVANSKGEGTVSNQPRSFKDYIALAIATCGVGYFPVAPGTLGSLVGVGLFVWARTFILDLVFKWKSHNGHIIQDVPYSHYYTVVAIELVVALVITLIGIWAASRVEKLSAKKDPGKVVIDEVAGQYIALIAIPFVSATSALPLLVLAFILFRFFDIVKPYPARRMESLHGGLGIMADDVVAGIYAAISIAVVAIFSRAFYF